jgi:hypothetical protein
VTRVVLPCTGVLHQQVAPCSAEYYWVASLRHGCKQGNVERVYVVRCSSVQACSCACVCCLLLCLTCLLSVVPTLGGNSSACPVGWQHITSIGGCQDCKYYFGAMFHLRAVGLVGFGRQLVAVRIAGTVLRELRAASVAV